MTSYNVHLHVVDVTCVFILISIHCMYSVYLSESKVLLSEGTEDSRSSDQGAVRSACRQAIQSLGR